MGSICKPHTSYHQESTCGKKKKSLSSLGASRSALCALNATKLLWVVLMKLCRNPSSCGRGQTGGCHLWNGFDTDSSTRSKCALKNACRLILWDYKCWNYSASAHGEKKNPLYKCLFFSLLWRVCTYLSQMRFAFNKHFLPHSVMMWHVGIFMRTFFFFITSWVYIHFVSKVFLLCFICFRYFGNLLQVFPSLFNSYKFTLNCWNFGHWQVEGLQWGCVRLSDCLHFDGQGQRTLSWSMTICHSKYFFNNDYYFLLLFLLL